MGNTETFEREQRDLVWMMRQNEALREFKERQHQADTRKIRQKKQALPEKFNSLHTNPTQRIQNIEMSYQLVNRSKSA